MFKFRKARFCSRFIQKIVLLSVTVAFSTMILLLAVFKRVNLQFAYVEGVPYEPPVQVIIKEIVPEDMIINLNTATKEELMTLDGIGEVTAEKILEYRDKNNGFLTIDELTEVDGIGEGKLEKIKSRLTIG